MPIMHLITLLNDEIRMTQVVKTLKELIKLQRLRIATLFSQSLHLLNFVALVTFPSRLSLFRAVLGCRKKL